MRQTPSDHDLTVRISTHDESQRYDTLMCARCNQGLIGEALVDLSPLADGRPVIAEWITIEDVSGRAAGKISVSARWVKPLRIGGDPGPHGLSAEEVEGLMARFSPEKDGQVRFTLSWEHPQIFAGI